MSRRSDAGVAFNKLLPPSHPQEHYPQHRAFLTRSLGRCDTDIAALVELNRSLHKLKASIVETCGEATLLDIGEGLLKLSFDERLVGMIPVNGQDLCADFLLRMKLRRRLLNRLGRRLNRLAHAMDGEDVQPPAPPKYGDLRLHIDPKSVEMHSILWKRQEEARKRIELRRQTQIALKESDIKDEAPSSEQGQEKADEDGEKKVEEEMKEEEAETQKEEAETQKEEEAETQKEKETETKEEEEGEMKAEEGGTKEEEEATKEEEGEMKEAEEKESESLPEGVTSSGKPTEEAAPAANEEEATIDYEVLRDFNDAYQKEVFPSTGEVKQPDPDQELDHNAIKYGAGIGATHRSMSSKEKEIEFKRWQAAILARIPDQPSFEELGLAKRVFFLEERRKRLAEEDVMSPSKCKKKRQDDMDEKSDSEEISDDEEMAEDNDDEADDDDEDYKEEADTGGEDDMEMDGKDEKEDPMSDEGEKAEAALIKPTKPISLMAVPSFYEQDLKRLRLIHADLMASSIHEHARRRVAEATMEYNQAYRVSNEIYNLRVKTQTDLNNLTYEHRVKSTKLKNDYDLEVAISRSRWQKQKEAHDADRARRSMPSAFGKPTIGTPLTASAVSRTDPVSSVVGTLLGNIIDSVVVRSESGWKDNDHFEDFNPPPPPDVTDVVVDQNTGETLGQRQERLEGALRKELADLGTNLHASEEARKRAWKKLLKTKAEFDIPHQLVTNAGGRKSRMQFDPNQFHLLPVPPLRASDGLAMIPPPVTCASPSIPSYVPQAPNFYVPQAPKAVAPTSSSAQGQAESKYSAAKVRERIAPDGSVMPVSEPKKTKDGLYQRPAGRTRKGMDWDAVRGIWVPAANPESWG